MVDSELMVGISRGAGQAVILDANEQQIISPGSKANSCGDVLIDRRCWKISQERLRKRMLDRKKYDCRALHATPAPSQWYIRDEENGADHHGV
jgi:hypothetical protein